MKEEESALERFNAQVWPSHGFAGLKLDKVNLDLTQILVYNKDTISLANGIRSVDRAGYMVGATRHRR
jgi:hypothetical protein